jgi:hypothetical protein
MYIFDTCQRADEWQYNRLWKFEEFSIIVELLPLHNRKSVSLYVVVGANDKNYMISSTAAVATNIHLTPLDDKSTNVLR